MNWAFKLDNGHQLTKDLAIHFLEIPKYAKQEKKPISEMSKMERWLAYFANQLDRKGKEELAMSEAAIQNAMEAARIFWIILPNDVYISTVKWLVWTENPN